MDTKEPGNITSGTSSVPVKTIKDSVFRDLFSMPGYLLKLYRSLHPEDVTITEDDLGNVTIRNILMGSLYNDLGFTARERLLVLAEAQSTWSINILVRIFMYLADLWKAYIIDTRQNMYGSSKVILPCPEFYVLYTDDKTTVPDYISLADEFLNGEKERIDLTAKVIRSGRNGDIIDQYIEFTRIHEEQVRLHGRTVEAIKETIRICRERGILREYLNEREKEVMDIMTTLFDQEYWTTIYGMEQRAEGLAEGRVESQRENAIRMHKDGLSDSLIARYLGTNVDTVKLWLSEI